MYFPLYFYCLKNTLLSHKTSANVIVHRTQTASTAYANCIDYVRKLHRLRTQTMIDTLNRHYKNCCFRQLLRHFHMPVLHFPTRLLRKNSHQSMPHSIHRTTKSLPYVLPSTMPKFRTLTIGSGENIRVQFHYLCIFKRNHRKNAQIFVFHTNYYYLCTRF